MRVRRRSRKLPEMSMASMGDIAFLLIIFFMVTTVFEVEKVAEVDVPKSRVGKGKPKQNLHVTLTEDLQIQLGEDFVAGNDINERLAQFQLDFKDRYEKLTEENRENAGDQNPEPTVILRGHETTLYRFVMDVIDEIKQAGVEKIALATKDEF